MCRHAVRVQQDPDLPRIDSVQLDTRHAVHTLDRSLELPVEHVIGVGEVPLARDPQIEDGLVPERAREDKDPFDIRRQVSADRIHLGAGLDALGADVPVPAELEEYLGQVLAGRGAHPFDAAQGGERLLDRPRDQGLDLLRSRAGVGHLDEDPRKLDVREFLQRQKPNRHEADQREGHEGHDRGDRPPEGELRVLHVPASCRGAASVAATGQRLRSIRE